MQLEVTKLGATRYPKFFSGTFSRVKTKQALQQSNFHLRLLPTAARARFGLGPAHAHPTTSSQTSAQRTTRQSHFSEHFHAHKFSGRHEPLPSTVPARPSPSSALGSAHSSAPPPHPCRRSWVVLNSKQAAASENRTTPSFFPRPLGAKMGSMRPPQDDPGRPAPEIFLVMTGV